MQRLCNNILSTNICSIFFLTENIHYLQSTYPVNIYLFKTNNRNTRKKCETCSKLTIKTSERSQCRRSVVFIGIFAHISQLFLVFLLFPWTNLVPSASFRYKRKSKKRILKLLWGRGYPWTSKCYLGNYCSENNTILNT